MADPISRALFLARRNLRNALIRYRRLTPGRLIRDAMRARILRERDIAPRAVTQRPERVVVGLTSIPERAALLAPALRGLVDQTCPADRLVLCWPDMSLRTGKPYPAPPDVPSGVEILRCEDFGPATKLLPLLEAEPGAVVIAVDDDVIYPDDFIETLLEGHRQHPGAALGFRGWRLQPGLDPRDYDHVFGTALRSPADVDILLGTWGYLIPPGALDAVVSEFSGWPEEVRWADDVWISGHLMRRGARRLAIPARGLPMETAASRVAALTDGINRSGHNDRTAIAAFEPWR